MANSAYPWQAVQPDTARLAAMEARRNQLLAMDIGSDAALQHVRRMYPNDNPSAWEDVPLQPQRANHLCCTAMYLSTLLLPLTESQEWIALTVQRTMLAEDMQERAARTEQRQENHQQLLPQQAGRKQLSG